MVSMDSRLQELHHAIASAIRGMSSEQLTYHPNENGQWSAAEVLEHLNLTYTGTIKNLERCLAAGKSGASPDRRSKRWRRIIITGLGYFPKGRKSPERVRPRGAPAEQVVREILENIAKMDRVISDCENRFGGHNAIADHPVLGPLTAKEWRGFHLVHGKHHAKQILRLKNGQN
jgi:hypothetical protein